MESKIYNAPFGSQEVTGKGKKQKSQILLFEVHGKYEGKWNEKKILKNLNIFKSLIVYIKREQN